MAQPLTDSILALTRYANETTGASDTNLSDAVRTLCDGYGGWGGGNTVSGTFTLGSNLSLQAYGQRIPNLQLPFQPDFVFILLDRESFDSLESYSATLFGLIATKVSQVALFNAGSNLISPSDYQFMLMYNTATNTSAPNGHTLNAPSLLSSSYYSYFSVNADGTISVGRYSSSTATKMQEGTYRYFALKI